MAETVTGFRGFREFRSAVPTFLTEDVLRDSQDGQVSGIRSYDETSQELRMLSKSLSDCRSLLLNLNLNLNRCLCFDCSDCSAIVVLL